MLIHRPAAEPPRRQNGALNSFRFSAISGVRMGSTGQWPVLPDKMAATISEFGFSALSMPTVRSPVAGRSGMNSALRCPQARPDSSLRLRAFAPWRFSPSPDTHATSRRQAVGLLPSGRTSGRKRRQQGDALLLVLAVETEVAVGGADRGLGIQCRQAEATAWWPGPQPRRC